MILATRVCVSPWNMGKFIDDEFVQNNVTLIDIPWDKYSYTQDDPMHFSISDYPSFCDDLAQSLRGVPSPLLILTDSTVDEYNDSKMSASNMLENTLLQKCQIHATVSAVCGSGFMSLAPYHFHAILSKSVRAGNRYASVLFMGGWNDAHNDQERVCGCVRRACHRAMHILI